MARLSDFQTAPAARNLAVEQLVAANAAKVHRNFVDWRRTRIEVKPGAVECFGRDAAMVVTRRTRLHTALDAMLCRMSKTQDDGVRLHAALDRLLDSNSEAEPEEDEDAEPAEDDGEENEDPNAKTKIPYDELSLDALQRTLDKTFGADDAAGLSRSTVMDAIKLGNPDDDASDSIAKLPIGFDINRRAKAPWFGALFTWINKHPKGTRLRDLNQRTLQSLLHELQTAA